MKLVSISLLKDEEFWVWYALTSISPFVDRMLVFDNRSRDSTVEIIKSMGHIRDKLVLFEDFGGISEDRMREKTLDVAREEGGTHVLIVDGDEVWPSFDLSFCREILERTITRKPVPFPRDPRDPPEKSGAVIRHLGVRPLHPSYQSYTLSSGMDWQYPENEHSCYNYTTRFMALDGLTGNREEWRYHGYVDSDGFFVQASPHNLWLPRIHYFHFMLHPRSRYRYSPEGFQHWKKPVDLGAKPMPKYVRVPEVLFRKDGPSNPTLKAWGIKK